MGVLDGLLRIKRVRESACEQEVRRARAALDEATAELEQVERLRRDRDEERQREERNMVSRLCAAPVNVRDIEWVRVDIDGFRMKAKEDLQREEQARARREEVREGIRAALKARQFATRVVEKFVALAERDRTARLAEVERLADLELEEFKARVPEPDDETEAAL